MADAPVYDPSMPTGGDPLTTDVAAQYAGLEYNYIYLVIMAFLVWIIIPGIGLFYSGLARRKSGLALLFQSIGVAATVTFQWMFWGYSLTFSRTGSSFIGDLKNFGLMNVLMAPSPGSPYQPEIVFCLYQMLFCACTAMLVIGGAFERGRILPSLIFTFMWTTIVYAPIAHWTWDANGWLYNLPSLDFAGGGPVHQTSGWGALAYAFMLGRRKHHGVKVVARPHNTTLVFLGTVLIWFGWFGFNGGSALNGGLRSMLAAFNTNTAACFGALGWILVDYIRYKGKFSLTGACQGVIAGLVGITPAAGYVSPWLGGLIGFLTAVIVALSDKVNDLLRIDDGLEVFKLHAIGGMVGSFLTGIFAQEWVGGLDGTVFQGGIDGNGIQVAKQLAEIGAIAGYSFVVTCVLLLPFKYLPFLSLRVSDDAETQGLDLDQFIDEQIGDWSMFEDRHPHHATEVAADSPSDSEGSVKKEAADVQAVAA